MIQYNDNTVRVSVFRLRWIDIFWDEININLFTLKFNYISHVN